MADTSYHPVVDRIRKRLDEEGVLYAVFEHEPARTSEEAAAQRPQYSMSQGTKSLIVRVKQQGEKSFAMVVVPGDAKFDTKKVRTAVGASDVRFASEDEVRDVTDGVEPGGVPPFGNQFGLPTYVDPNVLEHEEIIFNAGDKRVSIAMETDPYRRIVQPHVTDLVADGDGA